MDKPHMLHGVAATLRWCASLGAKFAREVPWRTQWIVLLTLVSQVSMLVASFLPLKVVIMLGSDSIPRYFPEAVKDYDRGQVLAVLSALAISFFVLHNLSERLIATLTRSGSRRLLAKSRKMVLFDNQDEVATQAYERFSRALAGGVFVGLAALLMLWLYPKMALVIAAYGLAVVALLALATHFSPTFAATFDARLNNIARFFSTLGFFTAFGTLLVDFTLQVMPNAIVAILSLLLTRQLMSRLAASVTDISRLWKQRNRLDALFFHRIVLMPSASESGLDFWRLLQPAERHAWISKVMAEFLGPETTVSHSTWFPLATAGVAGLQVATEDGRQYLLKLYNQNRTVWALHETDLMTEGIPGLPALPWLGATKVMDYHCLVYHLPSGGRPAGKAHRPAVTAVQLHLFALRLPKAIQTRYVRSRPTLDKRLASETFERLGIAADTDLQRQALVEFDAQLPGMIDRIGQLPLVLRTPDMGAEQLWKTDDGLYCLHWGRWTLEPAGAGFASRPGQLPDLDEAVKQAQAPQSALEQASTADIRLAALLHMLEASCQGERFGTGLKLVADLLQESD